MTLAVLDKHIEATPGVCGGRPRIAGRRITVEHVARWHRTMTPGEIAAEYDLTLGDVYAALAYYHDHQAEIDARVAEGERYAEEVRERTPSLVNEKLTDEERAALDAEVEQKVAAWEAEQTPSDQKRSGGQAG